MILWRRTGYARAITDRMTSDQIIKLLIDELNGKKAAAPAIDPTFKKKKRSL